MWATLFAVMMCVCRTRGIATIAASPAITWHLLHSPTPTLPFPTLHALISSTLTAQHVQHGVRRMRMGAARSMRPQPLAGDSARHTKVPRLTRPFAETGLRNHLLLLRHKLLTPATGILESGTNTRYKHAAHKRVPASTSDAVHGLACSLRRLERAMRVQDTRTPHSAPPVHTPMYARQTPTSRHVCQKCPGAHGQSQFYLG